MRILVGVDGSVHADRALRWALDHARARRASVTVLHVLDSPEAVEPAAEHRLVGVRQTVAAAADIVATVAVVPPEGRHSVTGALLRHARSHDEIVVGTRGRGGFAGLVVGSVSQQVAMHADVPVIVVPRAGPLLDGADQSRSQVVVGVDGAAPSAAALRWAVDTAGDHGWNVTAVLVSPATPTGPVPIMPVALDGEAHDGFVARRRQRAAVALDDLVRRQTSGSDVGVRTVALTGVPAPCLLSYAAEHAAVLAVGSRGHGGFAGLLLGSVSQQCVLHGRVPTVVVHERSAS